MLAALNAIFAIHRRSLLWTVMRIVRDPQTAEDLAQETYVKAHNALEVTSIEHLESYLYQTARNLALDHKRRCKTRQTFENSEISQEDIESVALDVSSAEQELIEQERQRLFEEALLELPVRARTAWALSHVDGWTYQQIAEHLNVSRNTVYNDVKLVIGHCRDALARLERG